MDLSSETFNELLNGNSIPEAEKGLGFLVAMKLVVAIGVEKEF